MIDRRKHAEDLLAFDRSLIQAGQVAAGMDEVGRGPLAGPVVTACVVMPTDPIILWVDDSKKLSEARREKVFSEICTTARFIGIGQVESEEIDRINILEATKKAMRQAAEKIPADVFLVDAVKDLGLAGKEISIIKGDTLSYSIAAASIVAKVIRDRQMIELDQLYPGFGFARNKGYGTAEHIAALRKLGPCPVHRRSFIRNFMK